MKRFFLIGCSLLILGLLPFGGVLAQDESRSVHIIQPGENLFRIAQQYGLTVAELAAVNGIADTTRILSGQSLVIPTLEGTAAPLDTAEVIVVPNGSEAVLPVQPGAAPEVLPVQPAAGNTVEMEPVYHTVVRGENLFQIASRYGTTEAEIIALNTLTNPNRILAGQQLLVGEEAAPAPQMIPQAVAVDATAGDTAAPANVESDTVTHTVQAGEYVSAIARRYGVGVNLILAANNIPNPDQVYAGQELIIPTTADAAEIDAILYAEPGAVVKQGREIVVDLSNSRVYAYENGILLYEAVSSNGLPATPTVQGNFTVRTKVRSQTMSGPGYWLPNVEWVMYFYSNYALHTAYWHDNFGQPMSHGCVNLREIDAKWFYDFAEIGTPVTVQY